MGTIATNGLCGNFFFSFKYLLSAPAQNASTTSFKVVPASDFNFLTRSKSKTAQFHFRRAATIPFKGVGGAENGAVGKSFLCTRVSIPVLIEACKVCVSNFGNFNGFCAKVTALFITIFNSLGSGFGLNGLGSGISFFSEEKSKIKLKIPAPATPSIAT